ncbi:NAD(P)/FAD-dependent oxidoreductase [Streptomyces sp. NPDC059850]|uniref:NAD(P)/FAD-dependent oxidoreductase n=1 Tax=Streptomyces sp. NPDC059850 TaxID=3346970 RepID=UPI003663370D
MGGQRQRIAVVGSGVAGLTAAYVLQRTHDVSLYEADDRLGGHAHTHHVAAPGGRVWAVDSGFTLHNERTYPQLLKLFRELGVATQESSLSMSVLCEGCGLQYAGARGLLGLLARPSNAVRGRYLRMLTEVPAFHRAARRLLDRAPDDTVTLRMFLTIGGWSRYFVSHFIIPLVCAVWSCDAEAALRHPAHHLFRFLDHHGLLSVTGAPPWRTVTGGSRTYVERVAKQLSALHLSAPVRTVVRHPDGVDIVTEDGEHAPYDAVVIAVHADQALRLLERPTDEERDILGAFPYSRNETVLHTDPTLLPPGRRARAAWNYRMPSCATPFGRALISYDMNRIQRLDAPREHIVTLGGGERVDESRVLARMVYEHPIHTPESVAAQHWLLTLNDRVTAFAGAYHGWGFHEDGCASGVRAAAALGVRW